MIMSEITVILDKKKLVVSIDDKTLRIDRPLALPQRVPLSMISRVIVTGNPMVSCDVWRTLSQRNIPVVLLPVRNKGEAVYLGSGISGPVENRMEQYLAVRNDKCALAICRWLLSMKLKGQEDVLRRLSSDSKDSESICGPLRKYRADMQKAESRNSLMGHEGAAAALYFRMLAQFIPKKWNFNGRNRRPPRDPVNSLLSLSYVIAGGDVSRAVQEKGLDPAAGFLHTPQPGRESLVLDILEPLRPLIDGFVLQILDQKVAPKDFAVTRKKGCLLSKNGRKAYYAAWSDWQESEDEEINLGKTAKTILSELVSFF